jgi:hypothetical protein
MQKNLRKWFETVIGGTDSQRISLRNKVMTEFQKDCAENAVFGGAVAAKTWGLPTMTVDRRSNLQFRVVPILTGVQSSVWYGLILLFASGLTRNVVRCSASRRGANPCGNYYLKSKKLRIACSQKCKKTLRHQQVYRAVKKIRKRASTF